MTGMTRDYAIAILRRMQEPEPYEPQINESAFDALEMAIDMIERYSTWSQTYSNMVEDAISRKAAVDVIHKYFAERIEQSPTHMTEDGEVYDLGICNSLLADNKALSQAIKELPSCSKMEQVEDCISRQAAIDAVIKRDANCGIDSAEVLKDLPSAQPEPLSDAYMKSVWTWLLEYQIKTAELKGRYTPYEVLSWVVNDWRKEHEGFD